MKKEIEDYLGGKIRKRIEIAATKVGLYYMHEDMYADYCLDVLEGKRASQTIDQFVIDWSREKRIITRAKYVKTEKELFCSSNSANGKFDYFKLNENPEHILIKKDLREKLFALKGLNEGEKEVLELFLRGYKTTEIADKFHYSYMWAYKKLNKIKYKIQNSPLISDFLYLIKEEEIRSTFQLNSNSEK